MITFPTTTTTSTRPLHAALYKTLASGRKDLCVAFQDYCHRDALQRLLALAGADGWPVFGKHMNESELARLVQMAERSE